MVRFINKLSNQEMWVAEDRVEEYIAAGHKLAARPAPFEPVAKPKKTAKKSTKKQG